MVVEVAFLVYASLPRLHVLFRKLGLRRQKCLADIQIGFNLLPISPSTLPNTKEYIGSYGNSALFWYVVPEKSHRQTQCRFLRNHLCERFAAQRIKVKNQTPKSFKKYECRPVSAPNRKPWKVLPTQRRMQSKQSRLAQAACK